MVPRSAVREDGGKHYVFVFDGVKLHRREISVGIASASKYEVLSGWLSTIGSRCQETGI